MRSSLGSLALGLVLAGALAGTLAESGAAAASERDRTYAVTITNLTRGQVITPPAVIVHRAGFKLFEVNGEASEGLAVLAESGNPGLLADEAVLAPGVAAVETGAGPILPGHSAVIHITADRRARLLSVAAMLATTNDAFAAVRGLRLPRRGGQAGTRAVAYDAGSEANNEDCGFIPGPPCNAANARDTAGAEGFIHIHNGVHGGADLVPAEQDWRNPVMQIDVVAIRGGGDDDDDD